MLDIISRMESEVRGYVRTYPTVFETASGSVLKNSNGMSYIDFFAGAGTLNYGHNNPKSKKALLDYIASDGVQHGLDTATTAKIEFIRAFEEIILKPRRLDYKLQFTGPTGTNAVEAAIKLARKVKQRSHVVAFTNAYHGHSLGSLALTGNEYYHDEHYGSHNNVTHLPFEGYLDGLDSCQLLQTMLDDPSSGLPKPAAVILETVQCEGGIYVASTEWLRRVAQICQDRDIWLIVDDIQVGNGRTGDFFSFEEANIVPDLVCLSKSIGGGLPMSLVLIRRDADGWKPGQHTGTFRGNNLAFVASKALLEYWRTDELRRRTRVNEAAIQSALNRLRDRFASKAFDVRGRGMVWGIDVHQGDLAAMIIKESFQRGLIVESAGATDSVIKLLPALTIEPNQLSTGLDILGNAFAAALDPSRTLAVAGEDSSDLSEATVPPATQVS